MACLSHIPIMTDDRRAACARLKATLVAAARERGKRPEMVVSTFGWELAWVLHERQVMLTAVNTERAEHGLPPVQMQDIERAESRAGGHADYGDKFALSCAELVVPPLVDVPGTGPLP
jgi:hypothetical protein